MTVPPPPEVPPVDGRPVASGPQIEGYTDLERIGVGGFSVVYRAHEVALHRDVAIKVLNSGLVSASERAMFERECRALGQLQHPDIVRVYRSAFSADDRPCIVMELYDGNFREVLDRSGVLPSDTLLDLGVRMAVALHVAHSKDVLHRDVKPHNIFRSRYGDPALGDFGIATLVGERTHTGPGGLSVAYAAPEILEEGRVGPSADVYALAATLYHLATGSPPFAARDIRQAVRRILTEEPPHVRRVDLPPEFDAALRVALAKDPIGRPADALAFADLLRDAQARAGQAVTPVKLELAGEPGGLRPAVVRSPSEPMTTGRLQRRRWIAAGSLVVAGLVVVGGVVLTGADDDGPPGSTIAGTPPPPDSFFVSIDPPSEASVVPGEPPGTFVVSVSPVDGVARYTITPVGGAGQAVTVAVDALPAEITTGTDRLCVVVQAVTATGRISPESQPFCSIEA